MSINWFTAFTINFNWLNEENRKNKMKGKKKLCRDVLKFADFVTMAHGKAIYYGCSDKVNPLSISGKDNKRWGKEDHEKRIRAYMIANQIKIREI